MHSTGFMYSNVAVIFSLLPPFLSGFIPYSGKIRNNAELANKNVIELKKTSLKLKEDRNIEEARNQIESIFQKQLQEEYQKENMEDNEYSDLCETDNIEILSSLSQMHNQHKCLPLSNMARKKLLAEKNLLISLLHSDEAISDLWTFWFAERGTQPASELIEAEKLAALGTTEAWEEAEDMFRHLISSHGTSWAEPWNRLATLLYHQGRLEESRVMCECVLNVKPWHFGALSGIVMVFGSLGDTVNANIWAMRRIPPLKDTERRRLWVNRALEDIDSKLAMKVDDHIQTIAGIDPDSFEDAWL